MTPTAVVQRCYEAFARRDMDALLALMTDDIDWRFNASQRDIPYGGHYTGKAEVARWFGLLAENDEMQQFEPREFLEGPGHVTVLGWGRMRPLPNGRPFDSDWVHVFSVRGDKVSRWIGAADTASRGAALT
jgi:ketosteroid isomerase-like protein